MKITFVKPDFSHFSDGRRWPGTYSLNLGWLSASAKAAGHQTSLIHITRKWTREEFHAALALHRPDILGFSSMSHNFPEVKELAGWAKAHSDIPVIYGGVHPSIAPEECLEAPGIDMACIGEGEGPLVELLNRMEKGEDVSGIPSIWVRKDGAITRNPVAPLNENLDALPYPDRDLFDYPQLWDYREKKIIVDTSRGCPFNCSYCINHQYRKQYPNPSKYIRFRSPEKIIEEILLIRSKFPIMEDVLFQDDTLCMKKSWLREFLGLYKKEVRLPFSGNTSIKFLDEEVIAMCADAGLNTFAVGIESGNAQIRADILKRKMTNEEIIDVFELAKKYKVSLSTYNMVGIPDETIVQALETVKLNARTQSDFQHVAILQPYKHTDIYNIAKEKGYLKEDKISSFFQSSTLDMPAFPRHEIMFAFKYFHMFVKGYAFIYRTFPKSPAGRVLERFLDRLYLSRGLKRLQLKTYPFFFFIFRPMKFMRTFMAVHAPKTGYFIKGVMIKTGMLKKGISD